MLKYIVQKKGSPIVLGEFLTRDEAEIEVEDRESIDFEEGEYKPDQYTIHRVELLSEDDPLRTWMKVYQDEQYMSNSNIAAMLNITNSSYCAWINGRSSISSTKVNVLLRLLVKSGYLKFEKTIKD